MNSGKTIRERVSILEAKEERLEKLIKEYEGLENIHLSFINELAKVRESIDSINKQMTEVYPIVKDVILVKGYGSFTWKLAKWIGGITLAIITSWHFIKDFVKQIIEYIQHHVL